MSDQSSYSEYEAVSHSDSPVFNKTKRHKLFLSEKATTDGAGFGTDIHSDKDLFSAPVYQTSALSEEYDRAWELYADPNKGLYNFQENEPEHEPETPKEIVTLKAKVDSLEAENSILKEENHKLKENEIL